MPYEAHSSFDFDPGVIQNPRQTLGDCVLCHTKGVNLCGGCNGVKYCSTHCQKKDWPLHKTVCKQYGKHGKNINPLKPDARIGEHFIGLLFPVEGDGKPIVVWLPAKKRDGVKSVDLEALLGPVEPDMRFPILANAYTDKVLPTNLNFCPKGRNINDLKDEPVNKTLKALIGDNMAWECSGDFVVFASHNTTEEPENLYPCDVRHFIDYLMAWKSLHYVSTLYIPGFSEPGPLVEGILINCDGDQKYMGRPYYSRISIHADHNINSINSINSMTKRHVPEIPLYLGLTLYTMVNPNQRAWKGRQIDTLKSNKPAEFLHTIIDPKKRGKFLDCEDNIHGSFIVVRHDGKPLLMEQLHILIQFRQYTKNFTRQLAPDLREEALSLYVTKERFKGYFDNWVGDFKKEVKWLFDD